MNFNSLDANAVTQPGGMYASANNGILEALKAYFAFKDRQQQGERELRRDERQGNRQQRLDGIGVAASLGVRPSPEDSGWLGPNDHVAIDAALAERARKLALTDADRSRNDAMGQLTMRAKRLEAARAGVPLPASDDLLGDQDAVEAAAAEQGAEQRQLQLDALRRSLLPKPTPQMPERSGWAPFKAKDGTPMLYNRQSGEVRTAIQPNADGGHTVTAPTSSAQPPAPTAGLISRQVQRVGDYWSAPTAQPRWSAPDTDAGASVPEPGSPVIRSLRDAGIDETGSFAGLLPDIIGNDPARRAAAIRSMPPSWRLRTIHALRAAGVSE